MYILYMCVCMYIVYACVCVYRYMTTIFSSHRYIRARILYYENRKVQ